MYLEDLRERCRGYPYFTVAYLTSEKQHHQVLLNQLSNWASRGYIWRLKRGLYTLKDQDRSVGLSSRLTSNLLVSPSYVSLDSVLASHGLIPERVFATLAVTTKKTQSFTNQVGTFLYRSLTKSLFFGFTRQADEDGAPILVAEPEKALLDKIYLDLRDTPSRELFEESWRLQNISTLRIGRLKEMAARFSNSRVQRSLGFLLKMIREERKK